MSIFNCTGNFNLLLLLSKMVGSKVNGKLRDHFGFKVDDNNKVIDGEKVYFLNYPQILLRLQLWHLLPSKVLPSTIFSVFFSTETSEAVWQRTGASNTGVIFIFVMRQILHYEAFTIRAWFETTILLCESSPLQISLLFMGCTRLSIVAIQFGVIRITELIFVHTMAIVNGIVMFRCALAIPPLCLYNSNLYPSVHFSIIRLLILHKFDRHHVFLFDPTFDTNLINDGTRSSLVLISHWIGMIFNVKCVLWVICTVLIYWHRGVKRY